MNCKPGDLAIVVRVTKPANLGRIVRVVRAATERDYQEMRYSKDNDPSWIVEAVGSPLVKYLVDSDEIIGYERVRPFKDRCLRPISGIPDTETTDTPVKIEEPA